MLAERIAIPKRIRFEVLKRDGFKCVYCGNAPPHTVLEVDHVASVASGGTNEISNLVTACLPCNNGKSDTSPSLFGPPAARRCAFCLGRKNLARCRGSAICRRCAERVVAQFIEQDAEEARDAR